MKQVFRNQLVILRQLIWLSIILFISTLDLTVNCKNSPIIMYPAEEESMSQSMQEIESVLTEPLSRFSGNLLKSIDRNGKNVIISPLSIHMALNLVLMGSDEKSKTEDELIEALGYSKLRSSIDTVHGAYNKLSKAFREISEVAKREKLHKGEESEFGHVHTRMTKAPILETWCMAITKDTLLPNYSQYLQKYYNGSVATVERDNPAANQKLLDRVNNWGKEAGFSDDLLTQNDFADPVQVLLLSAVRVEAFWLEKFYEHEADIAFYNDGSLDKPVKKVKCLINSDFSGKFVEFVDSSVAKFKTHHKRIQDANSTQLLELSKHNFRAMDIPLSGDITYTIIEPLDQDKGNTLEKLTEALLSKDSTDNQILLFKALQLLDSDEARTNIARLQMPKFSFQTNLDLVPILQSAGISRIFGSDAELRKISGQGLYVDRARHDAVIEVNQVGLKAAGVTKMSIAPLMAHIDREPIRVEVQNPFLFVIRYGKLPLFIGQLTNLSK